MVEILTTCLRACLLASLLACVAITAIAVTKPKGVSLSEQLLSMHFIIACGQRDGIFIPEPSTSMLPITAGGHKHEATQLITSSKKSFSSQRQIQDRHKTHQCPFSLECSLL